MAFNIEYDTYDNNRRWYDNDGDDDDDVNKL